MKEVNKNLVEQIKNITKSAENNPRWKHEEQSIQISEKMKESTDRLFETLEIIFTGWRASIKDENAIGNIKRLWCEEIIKYKMKYGHWPNITQGIEIAKQSESNFLPSIGLFLSWCDEDDSEHGPNAMLRRFNRGDDPITKIEQVTRSRCGYKAKRMQAEKGDAYFLKILKEVKQGSTQDRILSIENTSRSYGGSGKSILTRKENQSQINNAGLAGLPKIE